MKKVLNLHTQCESYDALVEDKKTGMLTIDESKLRIDEYTLRPMNGGYIATLCPRGLHKIWPSAITPKGVIAKRQIVVTDTEPTPLDDDTLVLKRRVKTVGGFFGGWTDINYTCTSHQISAEAREHVAIIADRLKIDGDDMPYLYVWMEE